MCVWGGMDGQRESAAGGTETRHDAAVSETRHDAAVSETRHDVAAGVGRRGSPSAAGVGRRGAAARAGSRDRRARAAGRDRLSQLDPHRGRGGPLLGTSQGCMASSQGPCRAADPSLLSFPYLDLVRQQRAGALPPPSRINVADFQRL